MESENSGDGSNMIEELEICAKKRNNVEQVPDSKPQLLFKARITRYGLLDFGTFVLYRIALDISYYFLIARLWASMGFVVSFDLWKGIESYVLLAAVFMTMPKTTKKLSSYFIRLVVLLTYVPMLTIYALKNESRTYIYAVTLFFISVFLLSRVKPVRIVRLRRSKVLLAFLCLAVSLTTYFIVYRYFGFRLSINLRDVYEVRAQYVELDAPFSGYFFNWTAFIINPLLFAWFLRNKNRMAVVLVVVLQVVLFSVTGSKTFLFALPFIWFMMRIQGAGRYGMALLATALTAIILLGCLSFWLTGDVWMTSLFTRRTMLVPAQLSFLYYHYFSLHEYTYLSQSILKHVLWYPYHLKPSYLIGETYFAMPDMAANTGMIGDAYMNFGFWGLAICSLIISGILKMIDGLSDKKNKAVGIAVLAMPSIVLTNSALLTSLLTHGLLLALVVLYVLPKEETALRSFSILHNVPAWQSPA